MAKQQTPGLSNNKNIRTVLIVYGSLGVAGLVFFLVPGCRTFLTDIRKQIEIAPQEQHKKMLQEEQQQKEEQAREKELTEKVGDAQSRKQDLTKEWPAEVRTVEDAEKYASKSTDKAYQAKVNRGYEVGYLWLPGKRYQVIKTKDLLRYAGNGNMVAQFGIGQALDTGYPTCGYDRYNVDYANARRWYHLSAAQGYGPAMQNLGCMEWEGRGGAVNKQKAEDWWKKAAAAGTPESWRVKKDRKKG